MITKNNNAFNLEKTRHSNWENFREDVIGYCQYGEVMEFPKVSDNLIIQAFYVAGRIDGLGHELADMYAHRVPPKSKTDREFLAGHCNGNQFEKTPWVGNIYEQRAREAGVDPKGKVYISGLARYPGDPQAWVSGRGDVQRICEQNGWGCSGSVKVAIRETEKPKSPGLAPDLVEDQVANVLDSIPAEDRPSVRVDDIREKVINTMTPHWAK